MKRMMSMTGQSLLLFKKVIQGQVERDRLKKNMEWIIFIFETNIVIVNLVSASDIYIILYIDTFFLNYVFINAQSLKI